MTQIQRYEVANPMPIMVLVPGTIILGYLDLRVPEQERPLSGWP